jgi:hypothetical protein
MQNEQDQTYSPHLFLQDNFTAEARRTRSFFNKKNLLCVTSRPLRLKIIERKVTQSLKEVLFSLHSLLYCGENAFIVMPGLSVRILKPSCRISD